jgi:hypothetical protein
VLSCAGGQFIEEMLQHCEHQAQALLPGRELRSSQPRGWWHSAVAHWKEEKWSASEDAAPAAAAPDSDTRGDDPLSAAPPPAQLHDDAHTSGVRQLNEFVSLDTVRAELQSLGVSMPPCAVGATADESSTTATTTTTTTLSLCGLTIVTARPSGPRDVVKRMTLSTLRDAGLYNATVVTSTSLLRTAAMQLLVAQKVESMQQVPRGSAAYDYCPHG